MKKNNRILIVLLILLLPLTIINVRSDHDWGDDFAQYLHQARNLCEGKNMMETGYLNEFSPAESGPSAYAPVFPIMLSPVYCLFENSYTAFNRFTAILLLLAAITGFLLFSKFIPRISSLAIIVLFAWHPFSFSFKNEILADFPFLLYVFLALYFYSQKLFKGKIIITALFTALAFSTKSQGIALALCIPLSYVLFSDEKISLNIRIRNGLKHLFVFLFFMIIINLVIFKSPLFDKAYTSLINISVIWQNILAYYDSYVYFVSFSFFGLIIWTKIFAFLTIILLIHGIILSFRHSKILVIYFFIYLSMLLAYDYTKMSERYLFHLLPFMLYFIVFSASKINLSFIKKGQTALILIFIAFFTLITRYYVQDFRYNNQIVEGPCKPESIELFNQVKNLSEDDDIILFFKARAMAYYSSRKSFYTPLEIPEKLISHKIIIANKEALILNREKILKNYKKQ